MANFQFHSQVNAIDVSVRGCNAMMNEADANANSTIFDEDHLQSRLELIRKYVSKPIPKQPWNDSSPALIPFHDNGIDGADHNHNASGGGIIIGGARHAANIPLLQSMNVTAVLNCASGVSTSFCFVVAARYIIMLITLRDCMITRQTI